MNTRHQKLLLPAVVLFISVLIAALFVTNKKEAEKKPKHKPAPFVMTQMVELNPITLDVKSQGLVQPKYETTLVAQVSGEITYVAPAFVAGGFVKKGDILAKIEAFNYEVALEQAKASLASARATFILERAQGQVAEAEWEKISSAQPSELGLRKPQQEQALAGVKAAQASVTRAQKDLDRTQIKAPYNALIKARNVSPGSYLNIGATLGVVANTLTAELRLPVKHSDFNYLPQDGVNSTVVLTSGKQQWQAKIVRTEGTIDTNTRMNHLVAEINDPYNFNNTHQQTLPYGTYTAALIQGITVEQAIVIERHWLQNNKLPVMVNNTFHYKDVTVLRHLDTKSIISNGLENGDLIITSSLNHPFEGMKVLPQNTKLNSDKSPMKSTVTLHGANHE